MKYLIIFNPEAGKGKGKKLLKNFQRKLKNISNCDLIITDKVGAASNITQNQKYFFDVIVAVGGDGTVHEVINGLGADFNTILGVLPIGSGNDFARSLNLNGTLEHNFNNIFINPLVANIDAGIVRIKEFGKNDFKTFHFANSVGIGFDGYVAFLGHNHKFLRGIWLYLYSVIKALFNFKGMNIYASFDDITVEGKKLLIAIGNGKTSGGGFMLNPSAEIDDEYLNACIADNVSKLRILQLLPKAIFGKHTKEPEINLLQFKRAKITLSEPHFVHSDGEILTSNAKELEIFLMDRKLKVIMGK